jgi:carbon-monoxide dehydrogenase medium subunit
VTVDADGRVGRCAFAVAGATPRPIRLGPAETAIIGQPLTDDAIRAASAVAADGLELVSDAFASGEYRGHLIAALLRRALAAIAGAGSGSQAPR